MVLLLVECTGSRRSPRDDIGYDETNIRFNYEILKWRGVDSRIQSQNNGKRRPTSTRPEQTTSRPSGLQQAAQGTHE